MMTLFQQVFTFLSSPKQASLEAALCIWIANHREIVMINPRVMHSNLSKKKELCIPSKIITASVNSIKLFPLTLEKRKSNYFLP
jgi:hypothetical protein